MRLALGFNVHTGWAAAAVAGARGAEPLVVARERVDLLDGEERFVFHKAAEMQPREARAWVEGARKLAAERARAAIRRLGNLHSISACAVIAKKGVIPPMEEVVTAHPRIHAAEGCFFRDALAEAAGEVGMRVEIIAPKQLDVRDVRLSRVGRVVGKPWSADYKLAVLAAWMVA